MALATASDISSRLGRSLDASETQIVSIRLDDAERLIRSRIRDLYVRIDEGVLDEDLVIQVEAEMVLRLVRNPDGYTNEQDGNYSYSIDGRVASGRLSVLPDEWALLGVRRAAFALVPRVQIPWACGTDEYPTVPDDDTAVWG